MKHLRRSSIVVIILFLLPACGSDVEGDDAPSLISRVDAQSTPDDSAQPPSDTSNDQSEDLIEDTETTDGFSGIEDTEDSADPDSKSRDIHDSGSASDTRQPDDNCPPNSHLGEEGESCYCEDGHTVNDDRSACVPECETKTDCASDKYCRRGACQEAICTSGSCEAFQSCSETTGACALDKSTLPEVTKPQCSDLPDWECHGDDRYCAELIQFDPRQGRGYWDYPINGENEEPQYRSWARRDLVKLVKYATARVDCLAKDWSFGNGEPLGLGDMSEKNGDIPGSRYNDPGHPEGTHVDGKDIDIAYYQVGTSNNILRSVCEHTENGKNQYHCVEKPDRLDVWRSALFIGLLHVTPQLRVIGVDGQLGELVEDAVDKLCQENWLNNTACQNLEVAYEVQNEGHGWFYSHHHHLHVSLYERHNVTFSASFTPNVSRESKCITENCEPISGPIAAYK